MIGTDEDRSPSASPSLRECSLPCEFASERIAFDAPRIAFGDAGGANPLEHQLSSSVLISQSCTYVPRGGKMKYFQLCKCVLRNRSTLPVKRVCPDEEETSIKRRNVFSIFLTADNYELFVEMPLIKITLADVPCKPRKFHPCTRVTKQLSLQSFLSLLIREM